MSIDKSSCCGSIDPWVRAGILSSQRSSDTLRCKVNNMPPCPISEKDDGPVCFQGPNKNFYIAKKNMMISNK